MRSYAYAARIVEPGSMIVAHEVPEWLFDFTRAVANACVPFNNAELYHEN